ncbi:NAD(P)/FAD-dependent oxidoreductase [Nanoarchaeota archaeon]
MEKYDIIIIGAGCTGFAAAMYSGRFDMKTLVLGSELGGTIIKTDIVENYPGFKKLSGYELAENLKQHALEYDIDMKEEKVTNVKKEGEEFLVTTAKETYQGKTILFATGTEWRKLNVPGEQEYANNGVHYCATCDGFAYKEKIIGIVGGSDSAAKEALLLTQFGKKVYIIYRGDNIRPEPINMKRVEEKIKQGKIEIIKNTNVVEIKGDGEVMTHVILDNPYNGETNFKVDGLFIDIGHIPLTSLAKDMGVELDDKNYIKINRKAETNIPGVYAAGDCADTEFKQAIIGVAEGTLAAFSAYEKVQ